MNRSWTPWFPQVRPFKGAPGKSSLMKPRVKNVGDGLLTQLEEQKKRIDHISRATAAERARAAASRAPSPAVVRVSNAVCHVVEASRLNCAIHINGSSSLSVASVVGNLPEWPGMLECLQNRLDSELDRLLSPDGLKMADPDAKDTFLDYEKAAEAGAER